jgi:hypothetical protein
MTSATEIASQIVEKLNKTEEDCDKKQNEGVKKKKKIGHYLKKRWERNNSRMF